MIHEIRNVTFCSHDDSLSEVKPKDDDSSSEPDEGVQGDEPQLEEQRRMARALPQDMRDLVQKCHVA